ncbi:D123-domain-containing protein [Gonapodya prolifera JEL478]|uniref:D123-domain-containing protein n=1 Tax=Gonapodya prolifera (strain JEL478) TaxID=1344416 RepID=A0A139AM04_GONPJ|nr:D123-domain-containing protein [Gonapodya prolifera JEL478]|eukprot:KXS17789.1 D123-domain-containing protein [Gonapodya prolifera JEL478]
MDFPSSELPERPPIEFPPLSRAIIDACALPSWLPKFSRSTFKTIVIELPDDFVEFLKADGIVLPSPVPRSSQLLEVESDADDDTAVEEDEDEQAARTSPFPSYSAVLQSIREAIDEFGAVFPKLDWSAPQDAVWIAPSNTLRCTHPDDVVLLIKASDFATHDLHYAYDDCDVASIDQVEPAAEQGAEAVLESQRGQEAITVTQIAQRHHLVLRKFHPLLPSMEFRCFVHDNHLVGITQRDFTTHYPFLEGMRLSLQEKIKTFWTNTIAGAFDQRNYVFDVYVDKRSRVWLVDFNPFAPSTDALLFTWREILQSSESELPELRLVRDSAHALANANGWGNPRFVHNRYPQDVLDPRSADVATLMAAMELGRNDI